MEAIKKTSHKEMPLEDGLRIVQKEDLGQKLLNKMVACTYTVVIGFLVLLIGGGGGLRVAGIQGLTIGGGAGAVIIVLGLLGIGC